ncbi:MAG: hypothetical protein K2X76_10190 [Sphingomonas sp.]|nr:hypothetical protein [Sphingomonas sp.]
MPPIQLATVLPGAEPFNEGNVNATFRGQILLADHSVQGAILKDLDARQLANELLVSTLARRSGLPTPDAYLALVRADDLALNFAPFLPDGNRIVFASVDVKVPNISFQVHHATNEERQQIIREILDWHYLGALYGFDTWVANIDRHRGNLLFGRRGEVWLIDHGHCLSGPSWLPADLRQDGHYRNRLSEWLTVEMDEAQKMKRLREAVAKTSSFQAINIEDIVTNRYMIYLLNQGDDQVITDFLRGRLDYVPIHTSNALGVALFL